MKLLELQKHQRGQIMKKEPSGLDELLKEIHKTAKKYNLDLNTRTGTLAAIDIYNAERRSYC